MINGVRVRYSTVARHKSGVIRGVASVYNRCSYAAEKRAALDLWSQHLARAVVLSKAA
jgi:hypothetical protein